MRSAIMASILAAVALTMFSSSSSKDASVVTLADYFDLGEERVTRELSLRDDADGRITAAVTDRCAQAVVRVRIHHGFHDNSYSTTHATGALIDHGRHVATVAHEMIVLAQHTDAKVEILLADGRVLRGRMRAIEHFVADRPETDWAFLDVIDPPADIPSLELGNASDGERMVLGFPGRHGRDESGRAVLDDVGSSMRLRPLRILCRARRDDGSQLDLVAGCVPIGGISGAPCVDARGRLVSIQRGVTETFQSGRAISTLNVVPVLELRAALGRATK